MPQEHSGQDVIDNLGRIVGQTDLRGFGKFWLSLDRSAIGLLLPSLNVHPHHREPSPGAIATALHPLIAVVVKSGTRSCVLLSNMQIVFSVTDRRKDGP
jgi:hypothetical protein